MRVFKRSYIDKKSGKREPTKRYYVEFYNEHTELRHRLPAYSDKASSEEVGRRLERLSALAASKQEPPRELRVWLEALPPSMQKRLLAFAL